MKPTKTPTPVPEWHSEALRLLEKHFQETQTLLLDSVRRAHWFGFLLIAIKHRGKEDGSIPHGRFGPWLSKHFPSITWNTAGVYMFMARSAAEIAKVQIPVLREFAHDGKLPPAIEKLIEGKTQRQLFIEYKQAQMDDEGNLIPARGRRPGEGGKEAEPTDLEENARFHREYSLRHMGKIDHELSKMGLRCLHCPDDQLTAFLSSLERTAKVLNHWLNTPRAQRDPKVAEKLWRKL